MKRSSLLKNILYIFAVTLFVLAIIIPLLLSVIGKGVYAQQKADDMLQRIEIISRELSVLIENQVGAGEIYRVLIERGLMVSDATIYVLDSSGKYISNEHKELPYDESRSLITTYFDKVISGERISMTSTEFGVFVGTPIITSRGVVVGGIFAIIPVAEVQNTLNRMIQELRLVAVFMACLLFIPIYIFTRILTSPVKKTADIALLMANGDFSVRAEEKGTSEVRHLAHAFNTMADNLQTTIDNLTIERNRLCTILYGIGEGIISVDSKGVITHYNSAAVSLLNGKEGDNPASLEQYADIARAIGETLKKPDVNIVNTRIGDRIVQRSTNPLYDENNSLCGAVVLLRDVTESERLENTRRDYVANVSHELRTPLASIRSLADALGDGMVKTEEDRRRYYGYIQRETIHLSSLINDLLELSRLQSGGVAFVKRMTDTYEIIFDVVNRMQKTAEGRNKHIRLLIPERKYLAYTNADRFEQVIVALIDNAIKHGRDFCDIDINVRNNEANNAYVFTVSNAADVEQDCIEHLFDRFYKADKAHTGEGTGIGLSIVSEVLNLLEENIWVDYDESIISFSFTIGREVIEKENDKLDE